MRRQCTEDCQGLIAHHPCGTHVHVLLGSVTVCPALECRQNTQARAMQTRQALTPAQVCCCSLTSEDHVAAACVAACVVVLAVRPDSIHAVACHCLLSNPAHDAIRHNMGVWVPALHMQHLLCSEKVGHKLHMELGRHFRAEFDACLQEHKSCVRSQAILGFEMALLPSESLAPQLST